MLNEADNLHMCVNDDVDDLMGNKLDIMSDEKKRSDCVLWFKCWAFYRLFIYYG